MESEDSEEGVLSDVHVSTHRPARTTDNKCVTRFRIQRLFDPDLHTSHPHNVVEQENTLVDAQGDLVVARHKTTPQEVITIVHAMDTPMDYVGLQVWRGALLLGDFLVHNQQKFRNSVVLELGCGSGFAGIVASRVSRTCFLTDSDDSILENCKRNAQLNSHLFENEQRFSDADTSRDVTCVRKLDWFWEFSNFPNSFLRQTGPFSWTESDLQSLEEVDYIIAADVIYRDNLTDALFRFLEDFLDHLRERCQRTCVIYLALEKRINFSLEELDEASPNYDYLRTKFDVRSPQNKTGMKNDTSTQYDTTELVMNSDTQENETGVKKKSQRD